MYFSEERARELLVTNPPNSKKIRDLIESSWFVKRPYVGVLQTVRNELHEHRCRSHPLYTEYQSEQMRESEALYLKSRVRRQFRAILIVRKFIRVWQIDFIDRYYAPGGLGMLAAKKRFEESLTIL